MAELELIFDPLPPDSLRRFVTESLASYNIAATGQSELVPVGFFLKNARGEWVGACSAISGAAGCMSRISGSHGRREVTATGRGCCRRRRIMPSSAAASPPPWRRTASRHGHSTKSADTKSSPRSTITRRGTRNSFLRKPLTRSPARPGAQGARFLVRPGWRSRPRAAPRDLVQEHRRIRRGAAPRVSRRLRERPPAASCGSWEDVRGGGARSRVVARPGAAQHLSRHAARLCDRSAAR